jgi:flagellar rod assembly protein/muramidase FlgJ
MLLLSAITTPAMATPTKFIQKYRLAAMYNQVTNRIPASIIIAQAALESGWGQSKLASDGKNFFGIKADSSWKGPSVYMSTKEYINGKMITVQQPFRVYGSAIDSFDDHSEFLNRNKRYASLFDSLDYKKWATGLQAAGYATDPNYSSKLIQIIQKHNLHKLDTTAKIVEATTVVAIIGVLVALFINLKLLK